MHRDRLEIIIDILEATKVESCKTALVYGTNLNFLLVGKYLDRLIEKGMLEKKGDKYRITERGRGFLEKAKHVISQLR